MRCDSSKLVVVVSYVTLEVMLVRRSLAAQNFPGVFSHAKKRRPSALHIAEVVPDLSSGIISSMPTHSPTLLYICYSTL
jgi:hypothetical protein